MDAKTRPFKKGMIILWSGSVASIPGGWALCKGAGGTPDLRNSFVIGAGDTYPVDDTGGATTHGHSASSPPHGHQINTNDFVKGSGSGMSTYTNNDSCLITVNDGDNVPPYFALAYIMKL